MTDVENATLPETQNGERGMVTISCAECNQGADLSLRRNAVMSDSSDLEFRGIVTCSREAHRWPVTIKTDSTLVSTQQMMPITEAGKISTVVRESRRDIVQDIEEAEDTYFYRAYKASVVMCRRAVSLSLEYHTGKSGLTLGPLLKEGRKLTPPALNTQNDQLAERILSLGNDGAHNEVNLDAGDVRAAIHDAVIIINELLTKQPASQSKPDSNAS